MEIFISAGEASGDLHGSHLARAIRSIAPGTRLSCLGGPLLKNAGARVVVDNRNISVVGASEVLHHARAIFDSWRAIRSHLAATRPDLVILIDFPDFNLMLGRFAKKIGARVLYYISPQIWAWRAGRIRTIKKIADAVAVILPFEKDFYSSHGMEVHYVGHPLVDILCDTPGLADAKALYSNGKWPLIGILPGSRRSEIKLLFELLIDAARIVSFSFPEAGFIIPVASSLDPSLIERRPSLQDLPVRVAVNDTHRVIKACDLVLTASGTVTLEAALLETPMIITYRVSRSSGFIGKMLIKTRFIGLPNLIAGRRIVPECVQSDATAEVLAHLAIQMLSNPLELERQKMEFRRVRESLGDPGVADRVARLAMETARAK